MRSCSLDTVHLKSTVTRTKQVRSFFQTRLSRNRPESQRHNLYLPVICVKEKTHTTDSSTKTQKRTRTQNTDMSNAWQYKLQCPYVKSYRKGCIFIKTARTIRQFSRQRIQYILYNKAKQKFNQIYHKKTATQSALPSLRIAVEVKEKLFIYLFIYYYYYMAGAKSRNQQKYVGGRKIWK
jgi:hypothetical protein